MEKSYKFRIYPNEKQKRNNCEDVWLLSVRI